MKTEDEIKSEITKVFTTAAIAKIIETASHLADNADDSKSIFSETMLLLDLIVGRTINLLFNEKAKEEDFKTTVQLHADHVLALLECQRTGKIPAKYTEEKDARFQQ
jgi:hypothetical protein